MAKRTRIVRLTGLGESLKDKIKELKEIRPIVTTDAQKVVIDKL